MILDSISATNRVASGSPQIVAGHNTVLAQSDSTHIH